MASCLGPNGGRDSLRLVGVALVKIAMSYGLAAIITVHLLLHLRVERSVDFGWPTPNSVNYLVLAIVISPVYWGLLHSFLRVARLSEDSGTEDASDHTFIGYGGSLSPSTLLFLSYGVRRGD